MDKYNSIWFKLLICVIWFYAGIQVGMIYQRNQSPAQTKYDKVLYKVWNPWVNPEEIENHFLTKGCKTVPTPNDHYWYYECLTEKETEEVR